MAAASSAPLLTWQGLGRGEQRWIAGCVCFYCGLIPLGYLEFKMPDYARQLGARGHGVFCD